MKIKKPLDQILKIKSREHESELLDKPLNHLISSEGEVIEIRVKRKRRATDDQENEIGI